MKELRKGVGDEDILFSFLAICLLHLLMLTQYLRCLPWTLLSSEEPEQ